MEYDTMIANIEHYIKAAKDFFIGGRGIGISCQKMAVCWKVEIERAAFIAYPDVIVCENDKLKLYNECGRDWFAEFDLNHYLKVQAI